MTGDSGGSRFHRSRDLFLRALEVDRESRSAFLVAECDEDAIRKEVEELLRLHESDGEFLERSAIDSLSDAELMDDLEAGEEVAGFRVVSVLGRGGMGVVYRARQMAPARDVALKLIRPGLLSRETARRFAQESALLARLQHPGIAQVYQAGTSLVRGKSRPYLAMELVEGHPIGSYAMANNLGVRERVELFTKACDAVHHAHVRGVVHRDLKPANMIVDGSGAPRILDFGIARLKEQGEAAGDQAASTLAGQVVGTLAYMSPEQASGDPTLLDSRSDVYSLGVVLFELLCGALPVDVSTMPLAEALRAILEREPARPSSFRAAIGGDLEVIILHALEKDPTRRYQHASSFADDLRRYLNDEPVEARKATAMYSMRKFAKRNRVLVGAGLLVFLTLVVAVAATGTALVRAKEAAARSDRINRYLRDMLQLDPAVIQGKDLSAVGHMLDSAAGKTDVLQDDPRARAAVLAIVGNAYFEFGFANKAMPLLEEAYPLLRELAGPDDIDTLFAMDTLAILKLRAQDFEVAEALLHESIRRRRAKNGPGDRLALLAENNLVVLLQQSLRFEESLAVADSLVARRREISGPDSAEEALAIKTRAGSLIALGRLEEAEKILRGALPTIEETYGLQHPYTISAMQFLTDALSRMDKYVEALEWASKTVKVCRESFGKENPRTIEVELQYFPLLIDVGRLEEADEVLQELIERFPRIMGESHPNIITLYGNGAQVAAALGDAERAAELSMIAERKARALLPDNHPAIARMLMIRAAELRELGQTHNEIDALEEAFERFTTIDPKNPEVAARAARLLSAAYEKLDEMDKAAEWEAKYEEMAGGGEEEMSGQE